MPANRTTKTGSNPADPERATISARPVTARCSGRLISGGLVVALLLAAAGAFWACDRDPRIAFLPRNHGAQWITFPKAPDATRHETRPLRAEFHQVFALSEPPREAVLDVMVFRSATIFINGRETLVSGAGNWKTPTRTSVARFLRSGTNDIAVLVTNPMGPPALWLRLVTDGRQATSDEGWQVSLAGSDWQRAQIAGASPPLSPADLLHGGKRIAQSLQDSALLLLGLAGISLACSASLIRFLRLRKSAGFADRNRLLGALLILVVLARGALFLNDLPHLPRSMGFDSRGHEQYIQFIDQRHRLPLAGDGWQMYQPPLYYLCCSLALNVCGISAFDDSAMIVSRGLNAIIGVLHCGLVLLCLRLLLPDDHGAQAAGLLVAAFLPPHLYLCQYTTNEPLAALFVGLALYLCLRALRQERPSSPLCLGVGAALGAAMLAKFSALLAVPVFVAALALQFVLSKNYPWRTALRSLVLVMVSILLVCGWHYTRVWIALGRPIVGNWDPRSTFTWWQDPGFHSAPFYFRFGQALTAPLFSGLNSFADGIYSTLWGDGLASGAAHLAFRPPWNYDLMNAAYLLALGLSLLVGAGLLIALGRLIRRASAEWFLVVALVLVFGLAILYMTLQVASYAQVKAFYALPTLTAFSALAATGWNCLTRKFRRAGFVLHGFLIFWTLTVYGAFWVRSQNPATHLVRGLEQLDQNRNEAAIQSLSRALSLNPESADAHFNLGIALERDGRAGEAVEHYRSALSLRPSLPAALNNLAWIRAANAQPDLRNGAEAVSLAERACELTHHGEPLFLGTLAAAYAEAGNFSQAVATAEKAAVLAMEAGQMAIAERNRDLSQIYRSGRAFHEGGGAGK